MPNLAHALKRGWRGHGRVADVLAICLGNGLAADGFVIEVAQFHSQNGSLNLVDAAIYALINVVISAVGAIVCQSPHRISQRLVVGSHSTGIAHRSKIFCGIETRCGSVSESAGGERAPQPGNRRACAYGLSVILNEQQVVGASKFKQSGVAARRAIEVHRHNGASACVDGFFNQACVEVQRSCIGIN